MDVKFTLFLSLLTISLSSCIVLRSLPVDVIQFFNLKMLNSSLQTGWSHFCNADVDEGVLSLFPEYSPSTVEILVKNEFNQTVSLPAKDLSQLSSFGFDTGKRTVLFISGLPEARMSLEYLQQKSANLNIIVMDLGVNIVHLYNTVKQSVGINGFLVAKVLGELKAAGLCMRSIVVVGHSVGANVAALGAEIFAGESSGKRLPLLIALDPAFMCSEEDFHVAPTVCNKVVVVHGENSVLSEGKSVGNVDIYLNGDDGRQQPGCSSSICSHNYSLKLFIHALAEGKDVAAVKCRDWGAFRRGKCNFNDSLKLGLDYDRRLSGKYFTITEELPSVDREPVFERDVELLDTEVELVPILVDEYSNINPVILK